MRTAFVPMTIFIVLVIMIVAAYHREVVRYKQTSDIICRTLTNPTIPLIEETKDAWGRPVSVKIEQGGDLTTLVSSGHDGMFATDDDVTGVLSRIGEDSLLTVRWNYGFHSCNHIDGNFSSRCYDFTGPTKGRKVMEKNIEHER